MKSIIATAILSLFVTAPCFSETWEGRGAASFSVKATGHTVHGVVDLEPFKVQVNAQAEDRLLSFRATADVLKMNTDNEKRDVEMQHTLHAASHPLVSGAAEALSVAALMVETEEAVTFPFTFALAGMEIPKTAIVEGFEISDDRMTLTVSFNVSQIEHGLTPIKKMGFLKVKDDVSVEVQFEFAPVFEADAEIPSP